MDLNKFPFCKIVLGSSQAVVELHMNQSVAYDITDLGEVRTTQLRSIAVEPVLQLQAIWSNHPSQLSW